MGQYVHPGSVITGRSPNADDDGLDEAIKDLAPHLALARVDALGRFIFANIAVVGTLLGALGLIGAGHARTAPREVFGAPLVVVLVGVSLVFALVAVTPWLFRLNRGNRAAVRTSYGRRIMIRGSAAMVAAVLFGGALVAAVEGAATSGVAANLTGELSGAGAAAKATMAAEITGLPAGATATATLADASGGVRRRILCRGVSTGDAAGKATISCSVGHVGHVANLGAEVSVIHGDRMVTQKRISIKP